MGGGVTHRMTGTHYLDIPSFSSNDLLFATWVAIFREYSNHFPKTKDINGHDSRISLEVKDFEISTHVSVL